jgi:hypothetical protein
MQLCSLKNHMKRRKLPRRNGKSLTILRRFIGTHMETCGLVTENCLPQFRMRNSLSVPFVGKTDRNRDEEIIRVLQADTHDESDPTKLW